LQLQLLLQGQGEKRTRQKDEGKKDEGKEEENGLGMKEEREKPSTCSMTRRGERVAKRKKNNIYIYI
jgi:hypothetical protein